MNRAQTVRTLLAVAGVASLLAFAILGLNQVAGNPPGPGVAPQYLAARHSVARTGWQASTLRSLGMRRSEPGSTVRATRAGLSGVGQCLTVAGGDLDDVPVQVPVPAAKVPGIVLDAARTAAEAVRSAGTPVAACASGPAF